LIFPITVVCFLSLPLSILSGFHLWKNTAREWRLAFVAFTSAFAAALWTLVFYPALMSPDSLEYWKQALAGRYSDWQPPMMAFLMRVVIRAWGPEVAVYTLLQATGFFLAALVLLAALTRHHEEPLRGRVLVLSSLFFMLFPVGWVYSVTLWKDVVFAIVGCLMSAFLVRFLETGRQGYAVTALAFLALSLAARHNAIVLVPAVAVLLHLGLRRWATPRPQRWITVALLCAAMAFPAALNRALSVRRNDRSVILASLLLGYDQRLERTEHKSHAPSEVFWNTALGEGGYRSLMNMGWECGDEWRYELHPELGRTRIRDAVRQNPRETLTILGHYVVHHPQATLRHHLCVVAKLAGLGQETDDSWYQTDVAVNELGLVSTSRFPALRAGALAGVRTAYRAGFCRHWLFLIVLFSMLIAAIACRTGPQADRLARLGISRPALLVLSTVGLTYFATFCIVPIAYDWRYLLFPTLLAVLALCVVAARVASPPPS